MKITEDLVLLAASDLANHLACRHLTTLDLLCARGEIEVPEWTNPSTAVLRELGLEHEKAYIRHLRERQLNVAEIQVDAGDSTSAIGRTVEAMKAGWEVIYQPVLKLGVWVGRADILLRVATPSNGLGDWSYEVVDCKLARETRAGTILQLALYSECVEAIQGVRPNHMHVVTPGTGFRLTSYRTADYLAYYRVVAGRLSGAVSDHRGGTYPEPTAHCDICRWWKSCEHRRRTDDHMCFVAGISKVQTQQLREWNIETLRALSAMPIPLTQRPRRGSADGYVRIREQARVQVKARQSNHRVYEMLPCESGRGLGRLPEPSQGDTFLDLEGDRFVGETGLDYLFGFTVPDEKGGPLYRRRWAFGPADEKAAFEWVVDAINGKLAQFPGSHVYHFGHYEATALKRLMGQYATREDAIDRMLRRGVFVDLHSIVRQSVRAGIEQYSLKELEQFHELRRETPLKEAAAGKRVIERALELSAPQKIEEPMKQLVESYNRDDCISALRLRDWLERLRTQAIEAGEDIPRPTFESGDPSESLDEQQQEIQALVSRLTSDVPVEVSERSQEQQGRWLLAYLLDYHRREVKASYWELFRLRDLEVEAYLEDKSAVAGLSLDRQVGGTAKIPIHRYTFPRQEIGFRHGKELRIKDESSQESSKTRKLGTVASIDLVSGTIDIKKTQASKEIHPLAAFVDPVRRGSDPRPGALLDLGKWVAENGIDSMGPYRAARDLLLRCSPRLLGNLTCEEIQQQTESTAEAAIGMGGLLQDGVLPIQGPPGAGKTYTGARMICELVRAANRVGVTALSHKVNGNLLRETVKAAHEAGLEIRCCQRVREVEDDAPEEITQTTDRRQPLEAMNKNEAQVGAGTAWVWAREEYQNSVDVLFIDEAGQMPLADVLAVSRAAKSLVLLGDPAQLDQPQQGSHPDGVAVSALQHLLGANQTLPNRRGIFLPQTWRLHPAICKFTSDVFYEGRLEPRLGLERQALLGDSAFAGSGLWFVPMEHRANQNSSAEEVQEVDRLVRSLIGSGLEWIDRDGKKHNLGLNDILVVAPYNVQVSDLMSQLPEGARVGTVDKFQGQQAPVVIYSMTTSSPEDAPRGMEFLYSLNRLNVATSRARCASILVASERLLEPECRTPRHMQLANALCQYVALAQEVRPGDDAGRRAAIVGAGSL